jgi:hypothetical protein
MKTCEFCKNNFKDTYLSKHKKTAKYCIEMQKSQNLNIINSIKNEINVSSLDNEENKESNNIDEKIEENKTSEEIKVENNKKDVEKNDIENLNQKILNMENNIKNIYDNLKIKEDISDTAIEYIYRMNKIQNMLEIQNVKINEIINKTNSKNEIIEQPSFSTQNIYTKNNKSTQVDFESQKNFELENHAKFGKEFVYKSNNNTDIYINDNTVNNNPLLNTPINDNTNTPINDNTVNNTPLVNTPINDNTNTPVNDNTVNNTPLVNTPINDNTNTPINDNTANNTPLVNTPINDNTNTLPQIIIPNNLRNNIETRSIDTSDEDISIMSYSENITDEEKREFDEIEKQLFHHLKLVLGDKKLDLSNIINIVIDLMKFIDYFNIINKNKKDIILYTIKKYFNQISDNEIPNQFLDVLPSIIDMFISIDKKKIKIRKSKLSCMFPMFS